MCVPWPLVRRNCFASLIAVPTRTRIHYNTRRLQSPTRIQCIRIRQTHEMRVRNSRARTAFHMSLSPISPFAHTSMKLHSSTHLSTHPSSNYAHHPPTHIDHQFSHTDHPGSFSGASSIVSRCLIEQTAACTEIKRGRAPPQQYLTCLSVSESRKGSLANPLCRLPAYDAKNSLKQE